MSAPPGEIEIVRQEILRQGEVKRIQLSPSIALPSYVTIPDYVDPVTGESTSAEEIVEGSWMPPQTDSQLWRFVKHYFNVRIPFQPCCRGHVSPFRAFADAYFARNSMIVWKASRGLGGKSLLLALLALTEQVALGASVSLLGGSGEQSKRVHKYMTGEDPNVRGKFWEAPCAPTWLLKDPPTQTETRLTNGGYLKTLMASQTSIRGPHPQRLRLDECKLGLTNIYTLEYGKQRIKDVTTGTLVFGWNGHSFDVGMVSRNRCNGVRDTLRIVLSNGKDLCVTANDPLLTEAGWKNADEIKVGENIVGMSEVQYANATCEERPKFHGSMSGLFARRERQKCTSVYGLWKETVERIAFSPLHDVSEAIRGNEKNVLHGLWHSGGERFGSLSPMSLQNQAEGSKALYGLRRSIEAKGESMQAVFFEDHANRPISGKASERIRYPVAVEPELPGFGMGVWSEDSSGFHGPKLGRPGGYGAVHRGSVHPAFEVGRRSPHWMDITWISARGFEAEEDRFSDQERLPCPVPSRFSENYSAMVFPDPIYHRVISIGKGPTEEVYDLTIPGLHSFVAEGVVVHNCDEMSWEIFEGAMGQTMAANGIPAQTVMSSTHQYPDGTMTKLLKMAAEASTPWQVAEWCYRENLDSMPCGWLMPSEVDRKRNEVSKAMWEVEYEMQEPSPEGRVIDPDAVRALFNKKVGVFKGEPNRQIVLIRPGHGEYYHGADWAKTHDWSVYQTNWRNPNGPDYMAAWARTGRRKWPIMIGMMNDRVRAYGGGPFQHDATGVGNVCHDYLEVDSQGFDFRAVKQRQEMLTAYIAAIERGDLIYAFIEHAEREHRYATYDELYGSGHLPDTIAAGALAWRARESDWVA